jgi:CelD/BcsL family acetyltransferase involved in cellulose biosynthesis
MPFGATIAFDFAATIAADLAATLDMLSAACTTLVSKAKRVRAACIDVDAGAGCVDRFASDWLALEQTGHATTAFQSLALARAAEGAHLRRGDIPRIVVVRDRGRPMVIVPTAITRWVGQPVVRFLGDPLIQYGDVLAAPDAQPHHFEAAWQSVADPAVARAIYLRKVRADSPFAPLLDRQAAVVLEQAAPYVEVGQRSPRSSRDARELRRLRRRQ